MALATDIRTTLPIILILVSLAATAAAAPAPADTAAAETLVDVEQMGFGEDVDRAQRQLVGESEEFPPEIERVFCLTRIVGAEEATEVAHVWYHEGEMMARVNLMVGSADWRTYSSKAILPAWTGGWEVKVLDADGNIIGSQSFTIR
jgi:hypothetical protein